MENPLKIGDKVRRINGNHGSIKVGDIATVSEICSNTQVRLVEDTKYYCHYIDNLEKTNEVKTMEELKNFKTENLIEAREQAEKEKATEEVRVAKLRYIELVNIVDKNEREIAEREEIIKKAKEELKLFTKKK